MTIASQTDIWHRQLPWLDRIHSTDAPEATGQTAGEESSHSETDTLFGLGITPVEVVYKSPWNNLVESIRQNLDVAKTHFSGHSTQEEDRSFEIVWHAGGDSVLNTMVMELGSLMLEVAGDDCEFVRPTQYALFTALELLIGSSRLRLGRGLPRGSVAADGDGGVRVEWSAWPDCVREVRLIVPSSNDGQSYIYHERDEACGVDEEVSSRNLARWLDRFADV